MKSDEKNGFKNKLKKRLPGLYLILRTVYCVIRRDKTYIQKSLMLFDDPKSDYLDIRHNGYKDYGKIIYVIKENSDREGFCATMRFILGYLLYAQNYGFEPVIRLSKEFIYYDEGMNEKIPNPWEYYFLSHGDDYDENLASNVCYCKYYHMMSLPEYEKLNAYSIENYYDEGLFKVCSPLINKYMEIKPEIISEASELICKTYAGGKKILGVHYRGTDYKRAYSGHPVCIEKEQVLCEIKKVLSGEKFGSVFLATDVASFYDNVKESFPEVTIMQFQNVYRSDGDISVAFTHDDRKYHHYLLGYEIARDMYALSLCDGLIAGKSSVSFMSNLYKHSRNECYEYMSIIDNGNNLNEHTHISDRENTRNG